MTTFPRPPMFLNKWTHNNSACSRSGRWTWGMLSGHPGWRINSHEHGKSAVKSYDILIWMHLPMCILDLYVFVRFGSEFPLSAKIQRLGIHSPHYTTPIQLLGQEHRIYHMSYCILSDGQDMQDTWIILKCACADIVHIIFLSLYTETI